MIIYYKNKFVTLYHGDNRNFTPFQKFDLCVTDPPYGIDIAAQYKRKGNSSRRQSVMNGRAIKAMDRKYNITDAQANWDEQPLKLPHLEKLLGMADWWVCWGLQYYKPVGQKMFAWNKIRQTDQSDFEIAGHNLVNTPERMINVLWNGCFRGGDGISPGNEKREYAGVSHPSQKPLQVIEACFSFAALAAKNNKGKNKLAKKITTVFDPFAGSGTTGVVATNFGLKCTLIEANEQYCELIKARLIDIYDKVKDRQDLFDVGLDKFADPRIQRGFSQKKTESEPELF